MKYKKQIQKGIKDINNIKLSFDEKGDILSHLDLYMKENPLKAAPPRVLPFNNIFTQFKSYKYSYSIAFVAVLLFSGIGVIEASERSLPGDILYPVKIKIVEPVKTIAKITTKAKVEYEEEKVIKRLDEVKELAKKGELKKEKLILVEKEVERGVKTILAIKRKNKIKATTTITLPATNTNAYTKDYQDGQKNDPNFKNKINTHLEEIKKENINRDEIKIFEEKVKNHLHDVFNDDNFDDKNINNIKINSKIKINA